jgi:hypothetical protein
MRIVPNCDIDFYSQATIANLVVAYDGTCLLK